MPYRLLTLYLEQILKEYFHLYKGMKELVLLLMLEKMLPLYLLVITSFPCIPPNVENVNIALILKQIFVRQYGPPKVRD